MLVPYDVRKKTIVSTDVSNRGLGAVVTHNQEEKTQCLEAAASRALKATELGYADIEKEALRVSWVLENYRNTC